MAARKARERVVELLRGIRDPREVLPDVPEFAIQIGANKGYLAYPFRNQTLSNFLGRFLLSDEPAGPLRRVFRWLVDTV